MANGSVTYENIQRLPPFLEGLQKRLLQTAFGEFDGEEQTTPGLLDTPLGLPGIQIAGADPLTSKAAELGESMVGTQRPFLRVQEIKHQRHNKHNKWFGISTTRLYTKIKIHFNNKLLMLQCET